MTRKHRRLLLVSACVLGLGTATVLVFQAFRSTGELFIVPSKIAAEAPKSGRNFRLGGMVEKGSVARTSKGSQPAAAFVVTDGIASVGVEYVGILPDLFREGQGVVALGHLRPDGSFEASEVLAKHDETYMPPDLADELRKTGRWSPEQGSPPAAALWNAPAWNAPPGTAQGAQKAGG